MGTWEDCRSVARRYYPLLTDNTIDALATDLLHNFRIFQDYPDSYPVKATLVAVLERETCLPYRYCQALAELLLA